MSTMVSARRYSLSGQSLSKSGESETFTIPLAFIDEGENPLDDKTAEEMAKKIISEKRNGGSIVGATLRHGNRVVKNFSPS